MPVGVLLYIAGALATLGVIMWKWQRPAYLVLRALHREPRGMTVDAIVQKTKISKQKIYPLLIKLKEAGSIESYDVRSVRLYKPTRLL